jgi:cytochrome c-type biogenesis protein CcmH
MQWLSMAIWLCLKVSQAEEPNLSSEAMGVALSEAPLFERPAAEEVETRTYALGKILRCPVCQGLSVADSQSDAAVAMKNRIKELVSMGYSDDQIIDYFIGRYGEFVLLEPKAEHWFVWWMPLIGLGAGIGLVALRWRSGTVEADTVVETTEAQKTEESASVNAEHDKYRAQLLAELED